VGGAWVTTPLALFSVFHAILDVLLRLGLIIDAALVGFVNLVLVAVGAALATFLMLLPAMPDAPADPLADWVGWLNWIYPVAALVSGLLVWVAIWATYLLVRIPLRWLRAL
jgi:hypothetical protein